MITQRGVSGFLLAFQLRDVLTRFGVFPFQFLLAVLRIFQVGGCFRTFLVWSSKSLLAALRAAASSWAMLVRYRR